MDEMTRANWNFRGKNIITNQKTCADGNFTGKRMTELRPDPIMMGIPLL